MGLGEEVRKYRVKVQPQKKKKKHTALVKYTYTNANIVEIIEISPNRIRILMLIS
jgi:hypothetical protein